MFAKLGGVQLGALFVSQLNARQPVIARVLPAGCRGWHHSCLRDVTHSTADF